MITLLILLALIGLGIYLSNKYDYEFLGFILIFTFGIMLFIHLIMWLPVGYNYELFLAKRNAFEQTLKESRAKGNSYETAAIVKEVAMWNTELAANKYDNKTFFFDQYIDDRIESLEPIK